MFLRRKYDNSLTASETEKKQEHKLAGGSANVASQRAMTWILWFVSFIVWHNRPTTPHKSLLEWKKTCVWIVNKTNSVEVAVFMLELDAFEYMCDVAGKQTNNNKATTFREKMLYKTKKKTATECKARAKKKLSEFYLSHQRYLLICLRITLMPFLFSYHFPKYPQFKYCVLFFPALGFYNLDTNAAYRFLRT